MYIIKAKTLQTFNYTRHYLCSILQRGLLRNHQESIARHTGRVNCEVNPCQIKHNKFKTILNAFVVIPYWLANLTSVVCSTWCGLIWF